MVKPKSVPNVFTLTFKTNDVIDQISLSNEYESEEDSYTPEGYVKKKLEKFLRTTNDI